MNIKFSKIYLIVQILFLHSQVPPPLPIFSLLFIYYCCSVEVIVNIVTMDDLIVLHKNQGYLI
jgi:hypothetical protein